MAQLGLDPEQMDQLAGKMQQEANQITNIASQITSAIQGVWWQGTDATRFKSDWDSHHKVNLTKAAHALEEIATKVRKEAAQQRQVSQ